MRIITKVEIHRFRSIADSSIEVGDITVFSGVNNVGKSNILRAINLFFNGETSFGNKYDFHKDYNQAFTGSAKGKRAIKITLHFAGHGNGALKQPFTISRSFELEIGEYASPYEYHSSNEAVEAELKKGNGNISGQFSRFLRSINFFYIPAVRDKTFVKDLFINFEQLLEKDKGSDFEGKIEQLAKVLETKSQEINKDFQEFIGLPTEATLSSNMTDILGAVQVNVDSGNKVTRRIKGKTVQENIYVNLFSSGDGILMSYLAYFLAHICKKSPKKNFIWGFEEPENSLEYSKVQKLAQEFSTKFKVYAQIFITTHSPAFIDLKKEADSFFYRVYKTSPDVSLRRTTEIKSLESLEKRKASLLKKGEIDTPEYKSIMEELGFIEFAAEIEKVQQALIEEQKKYISERDTFIVKNKALLAMQPQRVFICEDSDRRMIRLWSKWLKEIGVRKVKVIPSNGKTDDYVEAGLKWQKTLNKDYEPKVFRQIDRDGLTPAQILLIEQQYNEKYSQGLKYKCSTLPVCEIENLAVLTDPRFTEEAWKRNERSITEKFERKVADLCKQYDKKFDYKAEEFRDQSGYISQVQKLRREAGKDWKRFMPGKIISKQIGNYNPFEYLNTLSVQELPPDIFNYLKEAKKFF